MRSVLAGCRQGCLWVLLLAAFSGLVLLAAAGSVSGASAWSMVKNGSSQTLTASTPTLLTWEAAVLDAGESVIDLAGERFVIPTDGLYELTVSWQWESTVPVQATVSMRVAGSEVAPLCRQQPATAAANGSIQCSWVVSAVAGASVQFYVNPGSPSTVTARGNSAPGLRTSVVLLRLNDPVPTGTPEPEASPMVIEAFAGTALETVEAVKWALGAGVVLVVLLLSALLVVSGLRPR